MINEEAVVVAEQTITVGDTADLVFIADAEVGPQRFAWLASAEAPDLTWLSDRDIAVLSAFLHLASIRLNEEKTRRGAERVANQLNEARRHNPFD